MAMAKTIRMIRGERYPEPRTADVHPDEVANYRLGGWTAAEKPNTNQEAEDGKQKVKEDLPGGPASGAPEAGEPGKGKKSK